MEEPEGDPLFPSLFPRPMSPLAAMGWTIGVTLLLGVTAALVVGLGTANDLVTAGGVEVAVYLVGLFGILRVHAPEASIRSFTGLRMTHSLFVPLGLLLGVTLCAFTNSVYTLIIDKYPTGDEGKVEAAILAAPSMTRAAIFVVIVFLGPAVEELMFRGAITQGLRKTQPLLSTVVLSAALFGLAHQFRWQQAAPLALAGIALGAVRIASGSVAPTMLAHAAHNAMSFVAVLHAGTHGDLPKSKLLPIGALGLVGSLALVGLAQLIGRSRAAAEAREADAAAT